MSILISVFLGGGLGAIIRYLVIEQVNKLFVVAFPFGTIAVNVIGAFLIGLLSSYLAERLDISENVKMFLIVGFCGGFTAFLCFLFLCSARAQATRLVLHTDKPIRTAIAIAAAMLHPCRRRYSAACLLPKASSFAFSSAVWSVFFSVALSCTSAFSAFSAEP